MEYRIEISLDKAGLSPFDKCSGNGDRLWLHRSQLSSNYKQDNNFASMLNFEEGIRADRRAGEENDKEEGRRGHF